MMHPHEVTEIMDEFRSAGKGSNLIRAAIYVAEHFLDEGPVAKPGIPMPEFFECTFCGARAKITYEKGRVKDVAVMPHREPVNGHGGCSLARFEHFREKME